MARRLFSPGLPVTRLRSHRGSRRAFSRRLLMATNGSTGLLNYRAYFLLVFFFFYIYKKKRKDLFYTECRVNLCATLASARVGKRDRRESRRERGPSGKKKKQQNGQLERRRYGGVEQSWQANRRTEITPAVHLLRNPPTPADLFKYLVSQ